MESQHPIKSPVPAGTSEKTPVDETETNHHNPKPVEVGGPKGLEPTRYGDWEQAGRCTDF